ARLTHLACPSRLTRATRLTCLRHADGSSPLVEHVEHVGLAELDAHGPPPRPLRVVALEVAIDPAHGELQRDAALRPAADLLERGADDANQVAVVLATEVVLDPPAVFDRLVVLGFGV